MGPTSSRVEIDVPRELIFEFVGDLAWRSSFTDHFISDLHLTRIESSGIGAGARFRVHLPLNSAWMETTIVETDWPHRILEHGRGGRDNRVAATTVWELTEGPGALSSLRVSHWTEPSHPIDRTREMLGAASMFSQRHWSEALRRVRDLLEAGVRGESPVAVAGGNRYATGIP